MNKILIDVGSSTIKAYRYTSDKLASLVQRSIPFKEGFDPEGGITQAAKKELFELIESIKEKNKEDLIKIYATGIFRKLANETRELFIDEFFSRTGLFFNVIDQDLENFYLEMALVGKCSLNEPILLINIGGGSTELIVMYGKEAIERKNIDFGVGTINTHFPEINKTYAEVKLERVIEFIKNMLPILENRTHLAFLSGNELTYMQLAGYEISENTIFYDPDHSSLISVKNFCERNEDIFLKITLEELEALMPDNPKWMHGARGHSAIVQAICEKYGVQTIIPSNSNLIHGVCMKEFRYVTISGSFRKHLDDILTLRQLLIEKGVEVLSPRFTEPKNPGEKFIVFVGEEGLAPLELERYHLKSIIQSDALIVCDPNGYVGASALVEIGYANALGKRIIFVEKPEEFKLQILPAEIGL